MNDLRTMYGIAFKICVDIATPTQLGRRASHSNNGENSCSSVLGTTYATAICTVRPVCSAKSDNRFGGEPVKMAHDKDHDPSNGFRSTWTCPLSHSRKAYVPLPNYEEHAAL